MSSLTLPEGAVFDEFKQTARRAVEVGDFPRALAILREAWEWAQRLGTADQVDYAAVSRAALAIQLGDGDAELPALREVLMRSSNVENCRLAAYHISLHYELAKNFKKSLFYARIARDRAQLLGVPEWLASCHNQVGNALLGESFVEEARLEYERALELTADKPGLSRALILQNLGYCHVLQQRFSTGYAHLFESLRTVRHLGATRYQVLLNLDLCFAHLETNRLAHARRRGETALRLAERLGMVDAAKNALYLLGEAANLEGDSDAAYQHFSRLQRDHFPTASYLPGFLLAVDIRKLINLHA
jgi:tetratricopeptide (TPR) repeat protein